MKWDDQKPDMLREMHVKLTHADVLFLLGALVPYAQGGLAGSEKARLVGIDAATLGVKLSDQMQMELDRLKLEYESKGDNDATKDS